MQVSPSDDLSTYIKHYLFLDIQTSESKIFRLFSNGNTGIVFTSDRKQFLLSAKCEGSMAQADACASASACTVLPEASLPFSDTYVFGQVITSRDFQVQGSLSILIVVFQPYGLYTLTGIPGTELQDCLVESEAIFGKGISELQDQISNSPQIAEKIIWVNDFFRSLFKRRTYEVAPGLIHSIHQIITTRGLITVQEVASFSNLHERNLQRIFSQQIGLSPKKFIQVVKLHSFLSLLNSGRTQRNLTDIGLEAGYFDQAHLIREFKNIVGIKPSEYKQARSLAVNFVEVKIY